MVSSRILKISAVLVQMYYHHHNRLAANYVNPFVNDCDKYLDINIFTRFHPISRNIWYIGYIQIKSRNFYDSNNTSNIKSRITTNKTSYGDSTLEVESSTAYQCALPLM